MNTSPQQTAQQDFIFFNTIKASSQSEFVFVNKKHFHSINVQIIRDAQMQLTDIVARRPGSTHDSFILTNSMVGNRLEAGMVSDGWLLGE